MRAHAPALRLRAPGCAPSCFELAPGSSHTVRLSFPGRRARAAAHRAAASCPAARRWDCFAPGPGCICRSRPLSTRRRAARVRCLPRRGEPRAAIGACAHAAARRNGPWLRPFQESDSPRTGGLESLRTRRAAAGGALRCARRRAAPARLCIAAGAAAGAATVAADRNGCSNASGCGENYALAAARSERCRPGTALAQRRACLEALALYGLMNAPPTTPIATRCRRTACGCCSLGYPRRGAAQRAPHCAVVSAAGARRGGLASAQLRDSPPAPAARAALRIGVARC